VIWGGVSERCASPEQGAGESADTDRIAVAARRALGDAAFGNGCLPTTGQASFLG
jgi:hypothetical protein